MRTSHAPAIILSLAFSTLIAACDYVDQAQRSVDPSTLSDAPPADARPPDVVDAAPDRSVDASLPDVTDAPPRDVVDVTVADATVVDATVEDVTVIDATVADAAVDAATVEDAADDAATADAASAPPPLLLGLTVHLENHRPYDSAYATALQNFAATFAASGAVLTLEPRDEVISDGGVVAPTLSTLEGAGNSVGSHAAAGMESGLTLGDFTHQLFTKRGALLSVVDRVDHVSGICSPLDFVGAAVSAGFAFTTGATAACILAMTDRPAGYEDLSCASADDARCHASYPTELAQRIHPWRALDGAHWLTDDPAGRLVVIPSSGSVPCLTEEAASSGRLTNCRLDDSDVTTALADLDAAIAQVDPDRVNTYYWVWGSWNWTSSAVDPSALARLLSEVDRRVRAGTVQWATAAQMYDAYVAWEATHR